MSLCSQNAQIIPAIANLPFVTGRMSQDLAKDVEMLPRTTMVASQVGQAVIIPAGQNLTFFQARMVLLPRISVWEKRTHDEKKRDRIRGAIVSKAEFSNNTSDKPKDH